eukprot:3130373-Rhodomonas_salina.3
MAYGDISRSTTWKFLDYTSRSIAVARFSTRSTATRSTLSPHSTISQHQTPHSTAYHHSTCQYRAAEMQHVSTAYGIDIGGMVRHGIAAYAIQLPDIR